MAGTCGTYGGHVGLVRKIEGKTPRGRRRRGWESNIKVNLQGTGWGCGAWTGLEWLRLVTSVKKVMYFYVHMTVHRNKLHLNETNRRTRFEIYSCTNLYMFRVVPLPIITS